MANGHSYMTATEYENQGRPHVREMEAMAREEAIRRARLGLPPLPGVPEPPEARQIREQQNANQNAQQTVMRARRDQQQADARAMDLEQQRMAQIRDEEARRMALLDEYQRAQDEARQANEERYMDILEGHSQSRDDVARRMEAAGQSIDRRYDNSLQDLNSLHTASRQEVQGGHQDRYDQGMRVLREGSEDLNRRYDERLEAGMGMLGGAGVRERADINEGYRAQAGAIDASMAQRGLAGTTVGATLKQGNTRNRYADLGRANARLRDQAVGLYSGLSRDALSARERGTAAEFGAHAALSGDALSALERANIGQIGTNERFMLGQIGSAERNLGHMNDTLTGLDQERLRFMERREDEYPDTGPLMELMFQQGQSGGGGSRGRSGRGGSPSGNTGIRFDPGQRPSGGGGGAGGRGTTRRRPAPGGITGVRYDPRSDQGGVNRFPTRRF